MIDNIWWDQIFVTRFEEAQRYPKPVSEIAGAVQAVNDPMVPMSSERYASALGYLAGWATVQYRDYYREYERPKIQKEWDEAKERYTSREGWAPRAQGEEG
jgi:hypothetical protein